jgi:hypothetical protein
MSDPASVHCVSALCDAPAAAAFSYLSDGTRVGEWALGCWETRAAEDGVVLGTSLLDGTATYVRVVPVEEALTVDFEVGVDPEHLVRRISARVVGGDDLEGDAGRSLVMLLAWRTGSMDDERWRRLAATHEAEILILRGRIERSTAA